MNNDNDGNIILHQLLSDGSLFEIKEIFPTYVNNDISQILVKQGTIISWLSIDLSLNLIVNNRFKDTNIYYDNGRIGVGRSPLYNYKVDIAVPKNTLTTALHIGDGSFGFSMGNGTSQGFVPEIIGVGSDENDAGLYFVGIAGNNKSSLTPLIVIDGRNVYNDKLSNRPIFGVTSANYDDYSMLLDSSNNLSIKGNILAKDLLFEKNISLLEIIKELKKEIDYLKTKIT